MNIHLCVSQEDMQVGPALSRINSEGDMEEGMLLSLLIELPIRDCVAQLGNRELPITDCAA